jgi:7-cyano-7-deazaguanine synthase in queuosine biosynthesis
MTKKKIAILYSGGLDSFIMYNMAKFYHPGDEIIAVYFDHGASYCKREIEKLPDFVQVRKLDWLDETHTTVTQPGRREGAIMIPGRNLVFATALVCQELPDELWIGALHGETHEKGTDKNYTFLAKMNETLNYVVGPFRNKVPMYCKFPLADLKLDKLDSVKWALTHGISREQLMRTRSCHDGSTDKCGACIQCVKRWAVFGACGFTELYDTHPLDSEFGKKFVSDLVKCELGEDDYYGEETRAEIMPHLHFMANTFPSLFEEETLADIRRLQNLSRDY